jgi:hypothetical protein
MAPADLESFEQRASVQSREAWTAGAELGHYPLRRARCASLRAGRETEAIAAGAQERAGLKRATQAAWHVGVDALGETRMADEARHGPPRVGTMIWDEPSRARCGGRNGTDR